MAYVYILQSIKNEEYDVGSTKNVDKRFKDHQTGKVLSTKGLRPLKLILRQEYSDISAARRVEKRLKKLKRKDYLEKIIY